MTDFFRPLHAPATAGAVARRLPGARVVGDPDGAIHAIAAASSLVPDVLTFCERPDRVAHCRAAVVVVASACEASPGERQTFIVSDDVRATFIDAVTLLLPGAARPADPSPGLHPGARIDPTAQVSPLACIGDNVHVGAGSRIAPGAIVYADSVIGRDCVIGPGACIGWVGLAYHDRADGRRAFFPHLAGVRIGDRVDVGAQACICRGMLTHTVVGDDAKIGSLVYVSHGVTVDARAWLSAGAAIAGHATVGEAALLGIGSVVIDNVDLGDRTMVAGGSLVTRSTLAGEHVRGVPAAPAGNMRRFGPTPR